MAEKKADVVRNSEEFINRDNVHERTALCSGEYSLVYSMSACMTKICGTPV